MIFVVENAAIRFADGVDTSPPGISSFHFVFVPFPVSSPRRKERGRKEGRKVWRRIPGISGPRGWNCAECPKWCLKWGWNCKNSRNGRAFIFFLLVTSIYLFIYLLFFFPIFESNELRITRERKEIRGDGICKGEKVSFDDSLSLSLSLFFKRLPKNERGGVIDCRIYVANKGNVWSEGFFFLSVFI